MAASPTSRRSGKSLMGRHPGEHVTAKTPNGDLAFTIVSVE